MRYQQSVLRHRSIPPPLRTRGFPMPQHQPFSIKAHWSITWIVAFVFLLIVIGVMLAIR